MNFLKTAITFIDNLLGKPVNFFNLLENAEVVSEQMDKPVKEKPQLPEPKSKEKMMTKWKAKNSKDNKGIIVHGTDEMNFAFLPVGIVGKKTVYHSIKYEWTLPQKNGEILEQKITIEPGVDTGVPTGFDTKAWVALQALAYDFDPTFTATWIPFSLNQVCRTMRIKVHSENRKRIKISFKRLTRTGYEIQNAFYDNDKKTWKTPKGNISLIADYWLATDHPDDKPEDADSDDAWGLFAIGPTMKTSLQRNYHKRIYLPHYMSLSPTAAELYRFLRKQMGNRTEYKLRVMQHVSKVGISPNYTRASDVWKTLEPAIKEIIKKTGFLRKYKKDFERQNGKRHMVVYYWKNTKYKPQADDVSETEDDKQEGQGGRVSEHALSDMIQKAKKELGEKGKLSDIWTPVIANLKLTMTRSTFEGRFLRTRLLSLEDGQARIQTHNASDKDWIEQRLTEKITEAFEQEGHKVKSIEFVVSETS